MRKIIKCIIYLIFTLNIKMRRLFFLFLTANFWRENYPTKNSTCKSVDNNQSGSPYGKLAFSNERKYFI